MAAVLKFSDGTNEVDFLGSDFYLKRGGYSPKVANEVDVGVYEDIENTITVNWQDTDDGDRAAAIATLHLLANKCAAVQRERRTYNTVWMAVSGHTETVTRYALLKEIKIEKLPAKLWGPARPTVLEITFVREGAWRLYEPDGDATNATTIANAVTIENELDGANSNQITINSAAIAPSTARALLRVRVNQKDGWLIGLKTNESASELANFESNLYAAEATEYASGTGTISSTADGTVPSGDRIECTINTSFNSGVYWDIDDAGGSGRTLEAYAGKYAIYCLCKESTDNLVKIRYTDYSAGLASGEWYYPSATGIIKAVYLGRASVPYIDYGAEFVGAGYNIGVNVQGLASGTFTIYGIFLVPVDDVAPMLVLGPDNTVGVWSADGILQRTYIGTLSDLEQPINLYGNYMTLNPQTNNMFCFWRFDPVTFEVDFSATASVTIYAVERYLSLAEDAP